MSRLPVEILQQIIWHIDDQASLENLFLVTKPLIQILLDPILYKDISVHNIDAIRFIHNQLTQDYPWVAQYVQSLHVSFSGIYVDEAALSYVDNVLPILPNLKKLKLSHKSSRIHTGQLGRVACRLVIPPYQPFSLTNLILDGHIADVSALTAFLAEQHELEHLSLSAISTINMPHNALRNLQSLHAPMEIALLLLPGRHVRDIGISLDSALRPEGTFDVALDTALSRIRSLMFEALSVFTVARRMVNLQFLNIVNFGHINNIQTKFDLSTTKLRYLRLGNDNNLRFARIPSSLPKLFAQLPTLLVIDCEMFSDSWKIVRFFREKDRPPILLRIPAGSRGGMTVSWILLRLNREVILGWLFPGRTKV